MRPHLVLVIDNSGSMAQPQPAWCDTFNAIVDAVRYFSNTPLVSVMLFGGFHHFQAFKVPADHMQRFEWRVNFSANGGGTMLFSALEGAIDACSRDKEVSKLPTQFLTITDGGNGDAPHKPKLYDLARKNEWGMSFVGPLSQVAEMRDIQKETKPKKGYTGGDCALVNMNDAGLKALGLKGAEALENWMKLVARGKPAPYDFFGKTDLVIQ